MKARVAAQMEGRHLQGSVTDLRAGVPKSSAEFSASVCVFVAQMLCYPSIRKYGENNEYPAKIRHN